MFANGPNVHKHFGTPTTLKFTIVHTRTKNLLVVFSATSLVGKKILFVFI